MEGACACVRFGLFAQRAARAECLSENCTSMTPASDQVPSIRLMGPDATQVSDSFRLNTPRALLSAQTTKRTHAHALSFLHRLPDVPTAVMSETTPLLPTAAAAKRSSYAYIAARKYCSRDESHCAWGALTTGVSVMVGLACVAAIVGGGVAVHSHRAAAATSASNAALGCVPLPSHFTTRRSKTSF